MIFEQFDKDEPAILDENFANSSIVTVISQTPRRMFTRIKDESSDWEVMTTRLSKIKD